MPIMSKKELRNSSQKHVDLDYFEMPGIGTSASSNNQASFIAAVPGEHESKHAEPEVESGKEARAGLAFPLPKSTHETALAVSGPLRAWANGVLPRGWVRMAPEAGSFGKSSKRPSG